MARQIAFLRAVNVGGHFVKMEELRRHFMALKLAKVDTFIASGNVIFDACGRGNAALEAEIEAKLRKELGYDIATFVRDEAAVARIAREKPFSAKRVAGAGAFCVAFLKEPLSPAARKELETLKNPVDDFVADGREVYWLCTKRQSESDFSNALFEKKTGARATFRNLNTIARLAETLAA